MSMLDSMRDMQTQSIERVRSTQEQIISFNERIAETVLAVTPNMQSPFDRYVPRPSEMVDAYFGYLGQLHEVNKDFATRLAAAWDGQDQPKPTNDK